MDNGVICHYMNWIFFYILYFKNLLKLLKRNTNYIVLKQFISVLQVFQIEHLVISDQVIHSVVEFIQLFFSLLTFHSFITTDLYLGVVSKIPLFRWSCWYRYVVIYDSEVKWKIYFTTSIAFAFVNAKLRYCVKNLCLEYRDS